MCCRQCHRRGGGDYSREAAAEARGAQRATRKLLCFPSFCQHGAPANTAPLAHLRCACSGASAPQMPSAPDRKAERLVSQPHAARRRSKEIEGQDQEVRGQNEELRRQLDEAHRLAKSNPDERDAWTNERARAAACRKRGLGSAAAHRLPWPALQAPGSALSHPRWEAAVPS